MDKKLEIILKNNSSILHFVILYYHFYSLVIGNENFSEIGETYSKRWIIIDILAKKFVMSYLLFHNGFLQSEKFISKFLFREKEFNETLKSFLIIYLQFCFIHFIMHIIFSLYIIYFDNKNESLIEFCKEWNLVKIFFSNIYEGHRMVIF